jgi:hypothetical protein
VVTLGSGDLEKWCCKKHCNGCMNVAYGGGFGEETGAGNLVFFRVKWLQPAMR